MDKSIHVHAPASRVFAFLCRVAGLPRWQPGVSRAYLSSRDVERGAHMLTVTEAIGMRFECHAVITDLTAPSRFAWRQEQGDFAAHEGAWSLEEVEEGVTRVNLRVEIELPFVLPRHRITTDAEIVRDLSWRADWSLLNLKDELESPAGGTSGGTGGGGGRGVGHDAQGDLLGGDAAAHAA